MSWRQRIANVFRRGKLHRDIRRELAFHLAERADDLRARGLSETDARRQAQRQFGNFTFQIEETSDMNLSLWLDSAIRHVRFAARSLARSPGLTVAVVTTLALGIGANTAVFSALDTIVLRPLPYPESDRLVTLLQTGANGLVLPLAPVRLEDWDRMNQAFDGISGSYEDDATETSGELPEKLLNSHVASGFFQVLGVAPELGRTFSPEEERMGGAPAVIISDSFWRRRFGADPNVTSKRLRFGAESRAIAGVMPASFRYRPDVDIWMPVPRGVPWAQNRYFTWFIGIGRLKRGISLEQARANLGTVQAELGRQYPDTDRRIVPSLVYLKDFTIRNSRGSLWVVYGAVMLLLLIACTNNAALLLARATKRQQEISMRFSLGATRGSVTAQLLTETFLLAAMGSLAGLLAAAVAMRGFREIAHGFPRVDELRLDSGTLLYTLGCAVLATVFCGMVPAIRATRRDLRESLALVSRTQVGSRHRLQWSLVGIQVALSMTLLAGAGLLIRSFQELARVSPGFEARNVLAFHMSVGWAETGNFEPWRRRSETILDHLRSIPGVEGVALGPLPGASIAQLQELTLVEGRAESEPKLNAAVRQVTPTYFATMKIPRLTGRLCEETVNLRTGMVNRTFAEKYFRDTGIVGKHLQTSFGSVFGSMEIQGIVADSREDGLTVVPAPTVYPCVSSVYPGTNFLIRTALAPGTMLATLRRKIAEIEPSRSVYDMEPLEEHLTDVSSQGRMVTAVLGSFALIAIALASVGLYGTLSYLVNLRRREVGLRMALGAARGQIVSKFLRLGLLVSSLGCLAGLALAAGTTRLLRSMLFGVSPSDVLTLASVLAMVLAVTTAAALLPSFRASRVDPARVLRDD